jgi:hypothetical protein
MNPTREEALFPLAHATGLNSLIWVISASDNFQECLGLYNGVI